jgi:hypothetical protein
MSILSKRIAFTLAFLSIPTFADFEKAEMKNLNLNYRNPSGSATAEVYDAKGKRFINEKMKVTREETQLRLSLDNGEEVVIEDVSETILNANPALISKLNFTSKGNRIDFNLAGAQFINSDSSNNMSGLIFRCIKDSKHQEEWEKYLDACTTESLLNLSQLKVSSKSNLINVIKKIGGNTNKASETVVSDLRLMVKNHALSFSANIGLKVTGSGSISYKKNGDKNLVQIRIDKVKAGFFTVTNKFFSSLGGIQSTNVRVQKPYIYINF